MIYKRLFICALFVSVLMHTGDMFAQRAYFTEVEEGEDFYKVFWKRNLDSLHSEWVVENYLGGPVAAVSQQIGSNEPNAEYLFLNTDISFRRYYHPRIGEILDIYIGHDQDTRNAMAVFSFYQEDIKEILKSYKLPTSLQYLPFVVSSMHINAKNETGAAGYWQLMYPAARKYGLAISSYVDERKKMLASTEAAAQYLQQLYAVFQDWELALSAYMCGPTNVNKAIRRSLPDKDFDKVSEFVPVYSKDISYALCAANILFEKQTELGIYSLPQFEPDFDRDTLEISKRLHFVQLQDVLGISVDSIRFLNPQYKYDIVPALDEVYTICLPNGYMQRFNELEDSIYAYKDSVLFGLHKKVILPPPPKGRHYAQYEPEAVPENTERLYYTIKSGDNLGYVADWYDVNIQKLQDWNNIYNPRKLQIGQKIKVYVPKGKISYYKKFESLAFEQKQKLAGNGAPVSSASSTMTRTDSKPLGNDFFYHTVKSGESPYIIAQKYPGVSTDDILRWNNISDPRSLKVGQKLKIKKL